MLNILTEPIIRVSLDGGAADSLSLPETYSRLMADEVAAFSALRPHQRHAWHAFLCQLAAMALHRAGQSEPPADTDAWTALLRGLTPEWPQDEPWQLVVEDLARPAFMQPPVGSVARESDYKSRVDTPDELDMLVTSKNHDLKGAVVSAAQADDWLFALLTLQTMEGYGGRYNYGISRMPSGYGNRPAFSIAPSARPGGHLRRDVLALLEQRQGILDNYPVISDGICLVWLQPWDGQKAETLLINRMDPFYIEVCRRVRLRQKDGDLWAIRANSDSRRIADIKGLTGDPWAPVGKSSDRKGTPPAFLGPRNKLSYERVVDGLFSADWEKPPLLTLTEPDQQAGGTKELVARGMVRGEGGTEGYYERIIPLKPETARVFGRGGNPKEIEDLSRERIREISIVQGILRHAIATFAAGGDSNRASHRNGKPSPNDLARRYGDQLGEIVDKDFFDDLQIEFAAAESERSNIRNRWLKKEAKNKQDGVVDHAHKILNAAMASLPGNVIHYYKARVRAESVFWGRLQRRDGLPFLFGKSDEED